MLDALWQNSALILFYFAIGWGFGYFGRFFLGYTLLEALQLVVAWPYYAWFMEDKLEKARRERWAEYEEAARERRRKYPPPRY